MNKLNNKFIWIVGGLTLAMLILLLVLTINVVDLQLIVPLML